MGAIIIGEGADRRFTPETERTVGIVASAFAGNRSKGTREDWKQTCYAALLRNIKKIENCQPESQTQAYVYQTCRGALLSAFRTRKNGAPTPIFATGFEMESFQQREPEDETEREDLKRQALEYCESLYSYQKGRENRTLVYVRKTLEGKSQTIIAEEEGVRRGAVSMALTEYVARVKRHRESEGLDRTEGEDREWKNQKTQWKKSTTL